MLCLDIISVYFSILFYLDILNSVTSNDLLLQDYRESLVYLKTDGTGKIYAKYIPSNNYNICKMTKQERTVYCRNIIKRLRSSKEVYNDLYMNYLAFTVGEPCKEIKVWINQGEILAHQQTLNCFGRSAIMSVESSKEMVHFYQAIVIYPLTDSTILVFEYNQEKNYYMLLESYCVKWKRLVSDSKKLFATPVPQGWREVSNLFAILSPIHTKLSDYSENSNNILNSCENEMFTKICNVAFRSENYKKKFNHNGRLLSKPSSIKLQATLRGPVHESNLTVSIFAYTCMNTVVPIDRTFMSKYYIAAGPGDLSVILLEEMSSNNNYSPHYEIIEFVQNVTQNYIFLYFQRLY